MLKIKCGIVRSYSQQNTESNCLEILSKITDLKNLLKITLFFETSSDSDFNSKVALLSGLIRRELGKKCLPITYVSQKPLDGKIVAEYLYLDEEVEVDIQYKTKNSCSYTVIKQKEQKILFLAGLIGAYNESINHQGNVIFKDIECILKEEGMQMNSIVRQWNYIPNITGFSDGMQKYQQFNDIRTLYYNKVSWLKGYPAATGIGTKNGGLVIDLIATQGFSEEYAIVNSEQIDAHLYSDKVLEGDNSLFQGKTTPKFERAKVIYDDENAVVFVSGTAAIQGEDSCISDDVAMHTTMTLENIERLISLENLKQYGQCSASYFELMRVYIKREEDFSVVKSICEDRYPSVPFVYLLADVCREELLVEIEALLQVSK